MSYTDDLTQLSIFLQGHLGHPLLTMDAAIDLSDASKALDLANIRFQLMCVLNSSLILSESLANSILAVSKTQ